MKRSKNQTDLLSISAPIKLSEVDIDTYSFRVYGLDETNKWSILTKEKIPKATNREKVSRAFKILSVVNKHHLTKEGLTPVKLRTLLEDLGPTFIKMGQILSKRTELLPRNYCKELEKLCSESKPLDYAVIEKVIEFELGQPINELFSSFDKEPIGSASIGQAHTAKLKNGKKVVVKIQRPNIDILMRQDIMLLKTILKPMKLAKSLNGIDLFKLLDDMWRITQQELNFFVEAINTIKFGTFIRKYKGVSCPKVYKEYTTQKILTLEYIEGQSINDLQLNTESRKELGNRLAQNFISQVLNEEFFHADPHQGNIIIKMNKDMPEIVWIDFGMVHVVNRQEQLALKKMILAITKRDNEAMIQALLSLTTVRGEIDYARLYTDVEYLMDKYSSIDLKEINISIMLGDILSAVSANGLQLTSTINILARGLITLEGVLTGLTDELNLMEILKQHILEDSLKYQKVKQVAEQTLSNAITSFEKGIEIPALSNDLLRTVLRGQAKVNLNIDNTDSLIKEFKHSLSGLFLALVICSLIIGSAIICAAKVGPTVWGISIISIVGTIIAFVLSLILFTKQMLRKIK